MTGKQCSFPLGKRSDEDIFRCPIIVVFKHSFHIQGLHADLMVMFDDVCTEFMLCSFPYGKRSDESRRLDNENPFVYSKF